MSSRRLLWLVFLGVACAYLFCAPLRIENIDGQMRCEVAVSLLRSGQPRPINPDYLRVVTLFGQDQKPISYFGLAHSLLALPFLAVAGFFAPGNLVVAEIVFSLLDPLIGAFVVTLFLALLLALGYRHNTALCSAVLLAFASALFPSALTTSEAPQVALLFLALAYLIIKRQRSGDDGTLWLGGVILGWLGLLRDNDAAAALPLMLALLWAHPLDHRGRLLALGKMILAGLPFLLVYVAYNQWRFGSFTSLPGRIAINDFYGFPTTALPDSGALGLTLLPHKGLPYYCPLLLLSAWGWRRLYQEQKILSLGVLGTTFATLCIIAPLPNWRGDWTWGPRYLFGVAPMLHLGLCAYLAQVGKRTLRKAVLLFCVALGLLVQIGAVSILNPRYFLHYQLDLAYIFDRWVSVQIPEPQFVYHLRQLPTVVRHSQVRLAARAKAPVHSGPNVAMAPASPRHMSQGPRMIERFAEFDSVPFFWIYYDLHTQGRWRWPLRFCAATLLFVAIMAFVVAGRGARRLDRLCDDRPY